MPECVIQKENNSEKGRKDSQTVGVLSEKREKNKTFTLRLEILLYDHNVWFENVKKQVHLIERKQSKVPRN